MIELIDSAEAAALLGIKPHTLENWRNKCRGPSFVKLGKLVRYERSEIEGFIATNTVSHRMVYKQP